jgi:hypothetical protein
MFRSLSLALLLSALLPVALLAAASAGAATTLVHFQSPSGNINCIGGPSGGEPAFVECLVRQSAWPKSPPRPAGCDLDWEPHNLSLSKRHVGLGACRGDVGPRCFHDCTTLRYGRSLKIGPIRCRSAVDGVTCRYVSGAHAGFRIAREGYVIWRS